MRRAGEPNYFDDNSYNFLNKFSGFDSAFPFSHSSADEKR
jgi:hypothetical protein